MDTNNEKDIQIMNSEVMDSAVMPEGVAELGQNIQVYTEGRVYKTNYTKKFLNRKNWVAPNQNEVLSILPGVVNTIIVKRGDKVKKGEKLLIYEAMKMKNIITAPFDAVVVRINVKEGDKLPKGHLLVLLKQTVTK